MTAAPGPLPGAMTIDLWHTLLEPARAVHLALPGERIDAWLDALEGPARPGDRAHVLAMIRDAERRQSEGWSVPIPQQARDLARRTGRRADAEVAASKLRRAVLRRPIVIAPGVAHGLDALRARGIRLGLVSNVLFEPPDVSRRLLERTGLGRRFDTLYFSAEHRFAKPSATPFRSVLRQLGTPADRALHVGDSDDDRTGARAAGMAFVQFTGLAFGGRPRRGPSFSDWPSFPLDLPSLYRRALRIASARPDRRRQASA